MTSWKFVKKITVDTLLTPLARNSVHITHRGSTLTPRYNTEQRSYYTPWVNSHITIQYRTAFILHTMGQLSHHDTIQNSVHITHRGSTLTPRYNTEQRSYYTPWVNSHTTIQYRTAFILHTTIRDRITSSSYATPWAGNSSLFSTS